MDKQRFHEMAKRFGDEFAKRFNGVLRTHEDRNGLLAALIADVIAPEYEADERHEVLALLKTLLQRSEMIMVTTTTTAAQALTDLQTAVAALTESVGGLKTDVDGLKAQVDGLGPAIANENTTINNLIAQLQQQIAAALATGSGVDAAAVEQTAQQIKAAQAAAAASAQPTVATATGSSTLTTNGVLLHGQETPTQS